MVDIPPSYKETLRFDLASQKLEEQFLKWINIPSTNQLIKKLIEESKTQLSPNTPPPLFTNRLSMTASLNVSSPSRSSLTPPLSPSAYDRLSHSHSHSLPTEGLNIAPSNLIQKTLPVEPKPEIPEFYFPGGKAVVESDQHLKIVNEIFLSDSMRAGELQEGLPKLLGLPRFLVYKFLEKAANGAQTITKEQYMNFWTTELASKPSAIERLFTIIKNPRNRYIEREDFKSILRVLLDEHPGLDFLKATPEFQERYSDTVIERIFYTNDSNDTGKITLRELRRSNLLDTLFAVDEEEDINKIRDYFSYEHFYVLYCRFWELDTDHDFYIDKEDFSRYEGHTLSRKSIDRIFSEIPRKFTSSIPNKMCYEDFIWFMISEEDKTSHRSLEYWFKVVDIDNNGIITAYEMEYFYEEQLHRLEYLNEEAVPFPDVLCQMADLLNSPVENQFTLETFKAEALITGVFFNCLVNLNKFIAYEERDPFSTKNEETENPDFSEWDRFAFGEYVRLAMEEENGDNSDELDEMWDDD